MELFNTLNAALHAAGFMCTSSEEDMRTIYNYKGTAVVHTDGTGIWGMTAGVTVNISEISVCIGHDEHEEDDTGCIEHIAVTHDADEEDAYLYTDEGIEKGVSKLMGIDVQFTEQGMQDEFLMSMELA